MVDIKGLDKAEVLKALYDNSNVLGYGFLHDNKNYTLDDARKDFNNSVDKYFDYLYGHVMKVDLSKDTFDEWLYDRDNGEGAAQAAIDSLRKAVSLTPYIKNVNDMTTREIFEKRKRIVEMLKESVEKDKESTEDFKRGLLVAYRDELAYIDGMLDSLD